METSPLRLRHYVAGACAGPTTTIFSMPHPWFLRFTCILSFGLVLIAGCKRPSHPAPSPVPVRVAVVKQQTVPIIRTSVGVLQPLHSVTILSRVEGVITEVHFKDGDNVTAGQLLVTLDRRPFQAALQAAEAQLAEARAGNDRAAADSARYAMLHEHQAISDSDYSQYASAAKSAVASVAVQEAAVVTAKLNLDYTEIRAPIDGRASRLRFREGSLVRANDSTQPLLTINQLAPIGVDFSLPESDLPALQRAMGAGRVKVQVRLKGEDTRLREGELDYLDNTVGVNTGTIALRATFANADGSLWPGQFVDVIVQLGEIPDALIVPVTAIVSGQKGDQVFIVKPDNTIDIRLVHPGSEAHQSIVVDNVRPGENAVVDGQLRLLAGTRVTIVPPEGTAPAGANDSTGVKAGGSQGKREKQP